MVGADKMSDGIQAGDLMYAAGQLQDLANRTPPGNEYESLKVTIEWLNEQASQLPGSAITGIPPVR